MWLLLVSRSLDFVELALMTPVFTALRVYALCDRNTLISVIVLLLSLAPVITDSVR